MLRGQEATIAGGDRLRAVYIAARSLEAARSIRDGSFSSLAAGTYGATLGPTGTWQLAAEPVRDGDKYVSTLTIAAPAPAERSLEARTTWRRGREGSGAVFLSTALADWRTARFPGDWSSVAVEATLPFGGARSLAMGGSVLYAAAGQSPGLLLFDVSNPAAPVRINAGFALEGGRTAVAATLRGRRLYLLTDDPAAELQAFDISSPATLAAADRVATYDLPGNASGLSLVVQGQMLAVGARASGTAGEHQIYLFDIADGAAVPLLGSAGAAGSAYGIALSGTSAYLATSNAVAELGIADVRDPAAPSFLPGGGYNLTGSLEARSVTAVGSVLLLGQQQRDQGQSDLTVFTVGDGGIPPSPLYHQASGSLLGIAADPGACYAFLAADSGRKALQVVDLRDASLPEIARHDASPARAILYDPIADRLFLATQDAILVLRPGSPAGPCS